MNNIQKSISIVMLTAAVMFSQVSADLTIQNQQAVGSDFFFDIYITRTATNDLFLGTADFVLTFTSSAFTAPTLVRESSSFWNLTSTSAASVGATYRTATSPAAITGNELIINLNQVAFGDQSEFDDFVAKIDNTPNTHRVGRYKVTGITTTSEDMNLQWKTAGTGVVTQVFTLGTTDPWVSSPVSINAINPPNAALPVELVSFNASTKGRAVYLEWTTATEVNNYGFEIERTASSAINSWTKIGFVEGSGNSNSEKQYSYSDHTAANGSKFQYRLKQIDSDGQYTYSNVIEAEILPAEYAISQNYPNPFNPTTRIDYQLPFDSKVTIELYTITGEKIAALVNKELTAGYYKAEINAAELNLSSGVYFYKLTAISQATNAKAFVQVKKLMLTK